MKKRSSKVVLMDTCRDAKAWREGQARTLIRILEEHGFTYDQFIALGAEERRAIMQKYLDDDGKLHFTP